MLCTFTSSLPTVDALRAVGAHCFPSVAPNCGYWLSALYVHHVLRAVSIGFLCAPYSLCCEYWVLALHAVGALVWMRSLGSPVGHPLLDSTHYCTWHCCTFGEVQFVTVDYFAGKHKISTICKPLFCHTNWRDKSNTVFHLPGITTHKLISVDIFYYTHCICNTHAVCTHAVAKVASVQCASLVGRGFLWVQHWRFWAGAVWWMEGEEED